MQREKEKSENEGGTKETDRRWEEKGTERSEQREERREGNIGVEGEKMTGERTFHADVENYY